MTSVNFIKRKAWIVLLLTAPLGALLLFNASPIEHLKEMDARYKLELIATMLTEFRKENGRFPSKEEGINVLVDPRPHGKYFFDDSALRDPWGVRVVYHVFSQEDRFVVYSMGPNGVDDNGQGDDIK